MAAGSEATAGYASTGGIGRAIHGMGAINAAVLAVLALASWGMAVLAPTGTPEPLEAAWFEQLGARLGGAAGDFVRGDSFLADRRWFVAVYSSLVLLSSAVFVCLLRLLARERASLHSVHVRQTFRWAIGFAVVLAFAVPVLVQDFWLSAGWGRLAAHGINPYYTYLDPSATRGLPLDYLGLLATYGPLWTVMAGAVMLVAGSSGFVAGLLFKMLLCGAWLMSLLLVRRLVSDQPAWQQCTAVAIAGWLPLTLIHVVADGHNDIVMVVLVLLWLLLLERGRDRLATAALAASVAVKYLTMPLFLLDALHHKLIRRRRLIRYAPRIAIAALIGVGTLAIFYRSPAFFSATSHMAGWHFFTPRDAVVAVARLGGVEPGLHSIAGAGAAALAVLVQIGFACIGVYGVTRFVREPATDTFRYAVFAVAAGLLFGVIGHLWPWFLTWAIFMAALHSDTTLTRWTTGVALAAPFPLLFWVMYPGPTTRLWWTPPMYLFALAWLLLAPRILAKAPDESVARAARHAARRAVPSASPS